jgi:ABC-type transporter Mla MlaB component
MGSGNEAVTLALQGNLTISRIDEIHAELFTALHAYVAVDLDCTQAEDVDVAFLQILIAANRTAEKLGKAIRFATPPSGALAAAITRCGFPSVPATTSLAMTFSLPMQARS